MGVVSALGAGRQPTLEALRAGRSGIGPVRYLHTRRREFPVGEVPLSDEELAGRLQVPEGAVLSRTTLLGITALQEALDQAGVATADALISGTTVGGMEKAEQALRDGTPLTVPCDCGSTTEAIADYFGGFPLRTSPSTACSSAANALMLGARLLCSGQADIVAAGGSECLSDFHLQGFASLMILDTQPCRPFDAGRTGLNLGEGAAYLILEREDNALRRGARPLAVLSGWGNACDAFHQTASSDNGEGAFRAMQSALQQAGLRPGDISYVNAHGTGTPNNDASESAALRRVFGDALPPVSSTKGLTGHTTSASGSIETVFCLLSMQNGWIPGNCGFCTPDPACIVPTGGVPATLRHCLCNAFGFGGNDSALILSAYA